MKAYIVGVESDPDAGNEIVWAKNSKEARRTAQYMDISDSAESYIDVYVRREQEFDDMENASEKEIMLKKWHEGWQWDNISIPDPDYATDEEFIAVLKKWRGLKNE